jgi:hypothetical protein
LSCQSWVEWLSGRPQSHRQHGCLTVSLWQPIATDRFLGKSLGSLSTQDIYQVLVMSLSFLSQPNENRYFFLLSLIPTRCSSKLEDLFFLSKYCRPLVSEGKWLQGDCCWKTAYKLNILQLQSSVLYWGHLTHFSYKTVQFLPKSCCFSTNLKFSLII